jgi:hypothetical protein
MSENEPLLPGFELGEEKVDNLPKKTEPQIETGFGFYKRSPEDIEKEMDECSMCDNFGPKNCPKHRRLAA